MLAAKDDEICNYCKSIYIKSGYRKQLSYYNCICSVFCIHNETMNIWTHLLSSILFMYFGISNYLHNNIIFKIYPFIVSVSLLCSAIYHIFACNEKYYIIALTADATGIFCLACICVTSAIIDIVSHPLLIIYSNIYISSYLITIIFLYYIFIKKLLETYDIAHIYQKLSLTISILFWTIPIIHLYLVADYNHFIQKLEFWGIQYIYWAFCFFIFLNYLPERYILYKFDYILNSHNIFHILVTISALLHYRRLNMINN